jgi:ATP-binding cassette subfamily B protein RaxB
MGSIHGLRVQLAKILALGILLQMCALVAPFYVQWSIDEVIVRGDSDFLVILAAAFGAACVYQTVVSMLRSWTIAAASASLNFQWLRNTFLHLMRLPLSFFDKRHSGEIASRFGSIQAVQKFLTGQVIDAVIDGLLATLTLAVMLAYAWKLCLISLTCVAIYGAVRLVFFAPLREAASQQLIFGAQQQTHFMESLRAAQTIRLHNGSMERAARWSNLLARYFGAVVDSARITTLVDGCGMLIFGLDRVLAVALGVVLVSQGAFTVGMLIAYLTYREQLCLRLPSFIDKLIDLRLLGLHFQRVSDIVTTPVEISSSSLHEASFSAIGNAPVFELRNVSFRYADDEPRVLKNVNLRVHHGECVALVGGSGSGKTTLVKIILGLLDPTEGEVLCKGVPLKRYGLERFRSIVASVMQEDHLFAGSILDNIALFESELSQERAETSAKLASIHDDILRMPMGYQTLIGDIGTGLSGGQKQRILLARAFYKEPEILLLDEATSHLDVEKERLIATALQGFDLTRFIVAHRPETIASATRIVKLDQGSLVEGMADQRETTRACTESLSL